MKVASVVGRIFEAPTLAGAYPDLGELPEVVDNLDALRTADLVRLDRELEQAYLFKHVATQEVAYESLPFAIRGRLHTRIGTYLETSDPDGIDGRIDILAHHFWHGDDDEKKRTYLARAADAARASYANAAAVDYLTRLVPLLSGADRVEALLKLGKSQEFTGDWPTAEATAREALELAAELGDDASRGWAEVALAESTRKQGRYDEAAEHLAAARRHFDTAGLDEGVGQVLHLAGTVAAQRGEYGEARERYLESLAIRERLGDTAALGGLYSNLAIVAEYEGDMATARTDNERALALRREVGDRWAIGVSENNLGMIALHDGEFDAARDHFETSMRLNREVGDAWMVAIGHNNLGNATRGLGDLDCGAGALRRGAGGVPRLRRSLGDGVPARGHGHPRRARRRRDGRPRGARSGVEDARRDRRARGPRPSRRSSPRPSPMHARRSARKPRRRRSSEDGRWNPTRSRSSAGGSARAPDPGVR